MLDCHGGPETINHYEVNALTWRCMEIGDGEFVCDREYHKDAVYVTQYKVDAIDPPDVGSGWWYEIVAVDDADNRSDDPCP